LDETLDLAVSISTEKARSELIITPILLEIRRIFQNKIGYFSGNTFNVNESKANSYDLTPRHRGMLTQ
jgi:hypothetical protein